MDILIRAVVIGILGVVLTVLIKKTNPEIASMLALLVSMLIVTLAFEVFSSVVEIFELVSLSTGLSASYTAPVLKCVGIGIIGKIGSDSCKDANQNAIASAVELCSVGCALYVCLPLIKTFLRMIGELA